MTRRDVVKGAVALATLGTGSVLGGRDVAAVAASPANRTGGGPRSDRDRVAIIGAGAGGVAAAYFLAGIRDVDLFEARSKIGGHCDSHVIDYRGHRITVDLGAQFFHPDTHPIYGLSCRVGGDSSVRELDLGAGAAEVDHGDQRVG